jgi:hypothetical protein
MSGALDSRPGIETRGAMDRLIHDTIADPHWFPLRFEVGSGCYKFVRITPEMHRALTFLADIQPKDADVRAVARAAVRQTAVDEAPLHVILHSGLGGSTLLARALAQPGMAVTLKEPPILTDVVAYGLQGATANEQRDFLRDVIRLLARPFVAGEAVVLKMSSIGNGLVSTIGEDRPRSRILCLQTPLELMLASLASRGREGRLGGQRLFTGMRNARMIAVEPPRGDDRSDMELAALAWLSTQKMMLDAAAKFGPVRVRSISSERLIGAPGDALTSIAAHFGLTIDVDARLASGVLARHAKTGQPFDARMRAERLQQTLRAHGDEIWKVVGWARKIADANEIAWDLPYPLLD